MSAIMSEANNFQGERSSPGIHLSHGVYPELVEGFARNDINWKHINLNESNAAKYKRWHEKHDQMMDRIIRKEAEDPFRGS